MADITLTESEYNQVRSRIHTSLTIENFPNAKVSEDLVLNSACDYVFEELVQGLANRPSTLAELVAKFDGPQEQQFRRAILFRLAGLIIPDLPQLLSQSAGPVTQRYQSQQWEVKQASLFLRADEEIERLRNAYDDDDFEPDPVPETPLLNLTAFFVVSSS